MDEHRIPQTLDDPPLALIFNASQLFSFIGFTAAGVLISHPFIAGALGLVFGSLFTRYADKKPDGYLRHLAYFHGFPIFSGRCCPNGLEREFRP
jgi:conjugal transfer pilus assembly protein TraL